MLFGGSLAKELAAHGVRLTTLCPGSTATEFHHVAGISDDRRTARRQETAEKVARVGLNESEARSRGVAYEVTCYDIASLDRAITESDTGGFIKVLTVPGRDRVLGATIVSQHAAELLNEFVLAMRHGIGLNRILGTIHVYPSWSEAGKGAAGAWRRAHQPEWLLHIARRFHRWRRG